ncbi:N-acetyltransferase GCN5 [Polychaeton citri CBS 116435]|uniref:N-acetyltransferase GCN5 n=1 Tax=Polychaeton citri CBS 116435 TaxID=1314669 RepID=A0A9P4UUV2_9PEZI|nr:N-acetyltransferase GCN5 [Polychaeton citri CBS 116435]
MTASSLTIRKADFADPALISLIKIHSAYCNSPDNNVPGEETNVLDIVALQQPNVTLWTVHGLPTASSPSPSTTGTEALLGCGALKTLPASASSNGHLAEPCGELKSMHTTAASRRQGVGAQMLDYIMSEARRQGLKRLYLETGTTEAFVATNRFYARHGFEECGPYGDYPVQKNSCFRVKQL